METIRIVRNGEERQVDKSRWDATPPDQRKGWAPHPDEIAKAAAGAQSTTSGKSIKAPWWSQDEAPLQHTYIDPKNPSAPPVKVEAKGASLPWKNKVSEPPAPGMERKYPGGVPGAVRGALQGFTYNFADDVLDKVTGGNGEYQDLYEGTARENPGLWGVSNAAGSILARNPLSAPAKVAGGALRTAGSAVGPMTRGADRAVRIVEGLGGNGLINTSNRAGAMLTHAARAGVEGATANLGAQPQGEKDFTEAGKAGLEGMGVSTAMQVAGAAPLVGNLVPGSTGVGRFLQAPEAQITPSGSQFVPPSSLQKPTGWGALLNPAKQADYLATRVNPESLMDEAGDAAVSAARVSPGVAQNVLDSRSRLGSTPTEFGRTMVSYKIPQALVEPPQTNGGRALAWLQKRWPGIFGTGEVPLLPAGSNAKKADAVYKGAIRAANDVVDEVDRKAPPMSVAPVYQSARTAIADAAGRHDVPPAGLLASMDRGEASFPLNAKPVTTQPPPTPLGSLPQAPIPGPVVTFPNPYARGNLTTSLAQVTDPVPGQTVQIPTPEAAKWKPGKPVPVGREQKAADAGTARVRRLVKDKDGNDVWESGPALPTGGGQRSVDYGTATIRHRTDAPDFVPQQLPGSTAGMPISGGVLVRPSGDPTTLTQQLAPINPPPGPPTGVMVHPAVTKFTEAEAPPGVIRTEVGGYLRGQADYRGVEPGPLKEAVAAASGQRAVGQALDQHWQATLAPEDLNRGQAAKDLLTIAHAGADITNPMRGAVAAPRSLDSNLKAILAGGALTPVMGPAGGIAGRNIANVVDKASDINPRKMQLARRAEGILGQGVGPQEQAVGAFIRGTRVLPGRVNSAIVQGVEEDGPLMSMPDEPNVGPWQNALNKFLANLKR